MTGQDELKWVENVLKTCEPEVADAGFSEDVLKRIRAYQKRRLIILAPFVIAATVLLLVFFPYEILQAIGPAMVGGYGSLLPVLVPVVAWLTGLLFLVLSEKGV